MTRIKSIFPINTKLYFILLILQLSFYYIKCDVSCSECTFDNTALECKKDDTSCDNCLSNYETKKCYDKSDVVDYYIIKNDGAISKHSEGCQNKVIHKTNECVGHCPSDTYELGDFCYLNEELDDKYLKDETLKIAECKYKYYIEEISNSKKKNYTCLANDENCPTDYDYYDDKTNQCIKECVNRKIKEINDKTKRCSDECKSEEFLFSNTEDGKTYCSDDNPGNYCKSYYTSNNNVKICVNKCNEEDFLDGNGQCVSECEKKIAVDLSSTDNKILCVDEPNRSVYKYQYEDKYYFKNCTDTQNFVKLKRITYEFEYNSEYLCVDSCFQVERFIVNGEYKCTDCSEQKFYGTICYGQECPLEHNYISFNPSYTFFECVDECPPNYYESENKVCYPGCPYNQFMNSKFQCDTCTKPVNPSSIQKGEGYYVNDYIKFCFSFCPSFALYHKIDDNECFSTPCKEIESYKYSAYDNPYICYKSCKDINADYKYEKDYICYKTQTICNSYYYIENNIVHCASYEKCKEKYKYIKEKQCVNDCDQNYYRIKESYDTNGEIQDLGGCFPDERGCINEGYLFYNKTDKLCLRECDAFKLSNTGSKVNELGETCFSTCPSSHPYMDFANKLCLEKCPSYFYKYECLTGTCKDINKFNFKGEFRCLDSCQKNVGTSVINYYYDKDTNICYYSCNELEEKQYTLPNENNSPIECVNSCGEEYKFYYEDKKICRSSCDILYKIEGGVICVSHCASGQKVYNNICYDSCPQNTELGTKPKIYKEKLNSETSLIVEKCIKDCSNHLSSISSDYCYDECPPNESYIYNGTCYEKCPKETFANSLTKECFSNSCPGGLNFYDIIDDIKTCVTKCPSKKFISSSEINPRQCYDKCPKEYNFIGGNNTCLKNCSEQPDIGQYIQIHQTLDEYTIFKCTFSCGEEYTNVETKECLSVCPEKYYTSPNKMCYKNCSIDADYPFSSVDDNGKYVCAKKCHSSLPNFGNDKICKDSCNENEMIDYDGKCVSKCENSYYKYKEENKCVHECSDGKKSQKDNTCVETCPPNENFVEGNECRTSCDPGHFQKYLQETNEIKCVEKCESNEFYYETGSIYNIYKCLPKCEENDYNIENTQICVKECPSQYYIYFSDQTPKEKKCVLKCPHDKKYNDLRICLKECPKTGNKYHIEGETNCRYSCPEGTKINENKCQSTCPPDSYLDFKGENCISDCIGNYIYYIKGINQCLRECPIKDGYFIEDKMCVTSCSKSNPFLNGSNCQNDCSDFVEEYSHNNCTKKCPDDHPFYKPKKIEGKEKKSCIRYCELSMPDGECVSQCNETYGYINYENRTCLKNCPSFYVESNKTCYSKCPDESPFYNENTKECKDKCETEKYINITTNECMDACDFKIFNNTENKYCLKDCDDMGLFKFGENQCLKDCSLGDFLLVPNFANKTCECNYLYSIKDGQKTCLSGDECAEPNKYRLFGTQMCLENCNSYIYSLDGKYCYISEKYCPQNTKIIHYEETKYKCICSFKYYQTEDNNYVCLNENEECPSSYPVLIRETNQCVGDNSCGSDYVQIGKFCLSKAECDNKNYWYFNESNELQCTVGCPEDKSYIISETKQCVSKCIQTEYYITNQKNCISSCPSNTIIQKTYISSNNNDNKEVIYICACNTDLWYIDEDSNYICNTDNTKTKCEDIDSSLIFQVKDTKQCVKECPSDHPFSFNNECFIQCEDIKNYYDYDIVQSDNECKCKDLWKTVDNKKVCIEDKICRGEGTNLLISETRECTSDCPLDGQYKKFNNTCYKSCPPNTEESSETCVCKYKWYKYNDLSLNVNDIIICFENERVDCNKDFYPYFIKETRECIEDFSKCNIGNKRIFNNICSESCPVNTRVGIDGLNCVCDKEKGVWHKYTDNGQMFIVCGLTNCPSNKNFLDKETLECKYSCDKNKYLYKNGCYSDCPEYTIKNELSKECIESISFGDVENLNTLVTKVESSDISTIYSKTSTVGLVYNIKDSSMQIYGVNKKKTPNHELLMRSNLTYIDLSYCIDKLYADNNLDDDTDIVIVKYDRGDVTNSTTINPVEFKLFNSKTGNEITNLNGCNNNAIVISYPLSSILNSYPPESESNRLRNIEEKDVISLNLRQKFLIGKELYLEDEEIDSFNIENKLYTDMCYPLQLNGVDLILEDRVAYLYPDFPSCESNCIYNRTDFNLERIVCNCSPKQVFNLERQFESSKPVVDMEKINSEQKGSLLKCLFKVSNIAHNFGFFYGLIVILAEVGLMLLTLFYSYKMLNILIKKRFNIKNSIDLDNVPNEQLSNQVYKNKTKEQIIKTTERALTEKNNPPKKNDKSNVKENNFNKKKDTNKVSQDKKTSQNKKQDINSGKIEKLNLNENKSDKMYSSSSESSSYDKIERSNEIDNEDDNIFDLIKAEEKLLRIDYDNAIKNNKSELLVTILTEIVDKIYLVKSIFLLQKYELFSLYFSLYLLWHMLLLSFLSLFYNNSSLHKIWIRDNYPDLNYYLAFGFVSGIISFIIYKALSFLINYTLKLNEMKNIPSDNNTEIEQQYNKMKFWNKIKLIIFYVVEFILLIVFFLYLISFCGIYTATQSKLIQSYGIALIEIVIIKIIYGLILGILRRVSLSYKVNKLYSAVRFLDIYIS